ncbi:hypothetical protein K493DRAFT_360516 [Basidiobolus meristosporus CBS 931.73]|uniref:AAA+ ATPase domain-containing protein n=1 Tax=Basidiobolus meristosporus CBS 931.73 TaxID=1314790 RepID=A0A1Y1XHB8_9FUNG|nr:hypothetical protein K493DRAFT_360516 [Basidiobolus meristosporus CBS 931.73]|eukprot:ORX85149.1 hypothetical protein K493DRAFT_360516 [Basidiobolus meristosporus CBS 931.73]
MTALMGASGAGKTTLLDVLAQHGCPQPCRDRERSLQFSAYLRQPAEVSKAEKDAYVEEIIRLLEMEDIADAVIGDVETGVGISVEQRKRLTIGVELVAKPKLVFLDEPTSGLDAQAAFNIIRFMRKLANQGQAVLCTIHQPSAVLFDFFDHMLLLARGGKTVYFGELGPDSKTILGYFERNGAPSCAPDANPAEYILDVINDKRALDWPSIWNESPEKKQTQQTLDHITPKQLTREELKNQREFATPFGTQLKVVWTRMALSWWRNPTYNLGRHMFCTVFSLLLGFSFYKMGHSQGELQARVFALFQSSVMGTIFMNLSQPRFIEERNVYNREHSSKMYGWKPFWLSIMLTELPFLLVTITTFWLIFYYICGYSEASAHAIYSWLMYVVFAFFTISLGQMIASFSSSKQMAALLNPFFFSMLNLFCGVVVPHNSMPGFWRAWMYWLDPFHYWIEGLVVNELHNFKVTCKPDEFYVFNPPSGQTCGQYAGQFLTKAAGYLNNYNATTGCEYCSASLGDDFFVPLGWSYHHRWRNFGFMCMFWLFNIVVTGFVIAKFRSNSR